MNKESIMSYLWGDVIITPDYEKIGKLSRTQQMAEWLSKPMTGLHSSPFNLDDQLQRRPNYIEFVEHIAKKLSHVFHFFINIEDKNTVLPDLIGIKLAPFIKEALARELQKSFIGCKSTEKAPALVLNICLYDVFENALNKKCAGYAQTKRKTVSNRSKISFFTRWSYPNPWPAVGLCSRLKLGHTTDIGTTQDFIEHPKRYLGDWKRALYCFIVLDEDTLDIHKPNELWSDVYSSIMNPSFKSQLLQIIYD